MRQVRTIAAQWRAPQHICKTSKASGRLEAASSGSNWTSEGVAVDIKLSVLLQNVLHAETWHLHRFISETIRRVVKDVFLFVIGLVWALSSNTALQHTDCLCLVAC
jgi:hypothetical protein